MLLCTSFEKYRSYLVAQKFRLRLRSSFIATFKRAKYMRRRISSIFCGCFFCNTLAIDPETARARSPLWVAGVRSLSEIRRIDTWATTMAYKLYIYVSHVYIGCRRWLSVVDDLIVKSMPIDGYSNCNQTDGNGILMLMLQWIKYKYILKIVNLWLLLFFVWTDLILYVIYIYINI